jgi:uncharacterized membrane protein
MKSILVLLCIALFGSATFLKKIALDKLHPYDIQIISCLFHLITLPIFVYYLQKKNIVLTFININTVYAVVAISISMLAGVLFSFLLKSTTNIGPYVALVSLNPAITILLSFLFLEEKITVIKVIAFVLAAISAILISL